MSKEYLTMCSSSYDSEDAWAKQYVTSKESLRDYPELCQCSHLEIIIKDEQKREV